MSDDLNAELVGPDDVKQEVNKALPALRKLLVEKGYLADPDAPLPDTLKALANAALQNRASSKGFSGIEAVRLVASYNNNEGIYAEGLLKVINNINSVSPDDIQSAVNVKDATFLIKQITNGRDSLNAQDLQEFLGGNSTLIANAVIETYGKNGVINAKALTYFLNDIRNNQPNLNVEEPARDSRGTLVFAGEMRAQMFAVIEDNRSLMQGINTNLETIHTRVVGAPIGVVNAPSSKTPQL